MSTSCVYPLSTEHAFRFARQVGFAGLEVMVTKDPATQDAAALLALSARYSVPILSIHAPVLLFSQLVWGTDPVGKLRRSVELARAVGATTVVVHPPFRWEVGYARVFERTIRELASESGIELAVENMFPLTFGGRSVRGYSPSDNPTLVDCDAMTLDFSHAALAGRDALELAQAMGDRLRHVHLTDGTRAMGQGGLLDEHLVPGQGTQPVAEVLRLLALGDWNGSLIAEVHTHGTESERLGMLAETLAFARRHSARMRPSEVHTP